MTPIDAEKDDTFRWDMWHLKIKDGHAGERQRVVDGLNEAATQEGNPTFTLDESKPLYVIGYLNAPRSYYDGEIGTCKHHLVARMGVALTQDFKTTHIINDDAFNIDDVARTSGAAAAHPTEGDVPGAEKGCLWTGSFVRGARIEDPETGQERQQYVMAYTHRMPKGAGSPDGMTQQIELATTEDFLHFTPLGVSIKPDPRLPFRKGVRRGAIDSNNAIIPCAGCFAIVEHGVAICAEALF
jgi:hypothetical protein